MRNNLSGYLTVYVLLLVAICTPSCFASQQARDRFDGVCPSLQDAKPPELLKFLDQTKPGDENAWCVVWAIHQLGNSRYEPSIATLVGLLDFRRPKTEAEKLGVALRPEIAEELFPATEALETIGDLALPDVLRVIEAESASATARGNAVSVWMEAYKYDRPRGVGLLRKEELRSKDDTKQRLRWAVQRALTYCGQVPDNEAVSCQKAAETSKP